VGFGDPNMKIKKNIPARQRSFMARMGGVLKQVRGQKNLSAAYWSIRAWRKGFKV
jgi:NADPH-dependent glutamate synthase beta subunit-like oxidoreductase